jgi:DNA-binding MarR family transcriptional regulator
LSRTLIICLQPKEAALESSSITDYSDMIGHLARRFQQIAVAVFRVEAENAGFDLTPVQYAALAAIWKNPGTDQITLAGMIAFDRTTIAGVVDRLVRKGLIERQTSSRDRRARALQVTEHGTRTLEAVAPAVAAAQEAMVHGLTSREKQDLLRILRKAVATGNAHSRAPLRAVSRGGRGK